MLSARSQSPARTLSELNDNRIGVVLQSSRDEHHCAETTKIVNTFSIVECMILLLMVAIPSSSAGQVSNPAQMPAWSRQVQALTSENRLDSALTIVDHRLAEAPGDLEAQGWHARILSWEGFWDQAEVEYRRILRCTPNDIDILTGLSDVLVWKNSPSAALSPLERALQLSPGNTALLLRRARILELVGRRSESLNVYKEVLTHAPQNQEAKKRLFALRSDSKHELRISDDLDLLSYAPNGQTQTFSIASRWSHTWSTEIAASAWQRFSERAVKLSASTVLRMSRQDSFFIGGAIADDHKVIPHAEASLGYGHGFNVNNRFLRDYEITYQTGWLWYRDAHVLTIGLTQLLYFPRDFTWTLSLRGARTGFSTPPIEWAPSGLTKLQFPVLRHFTAQSFFGIGTESISEIDQIGRFSARTFGGGLRYRFASNQDIGGYTAFQNRSFNQTQTSFGLTYGIHF